MRQSENFDRKNKFQSSATDAHGKVYPFMSTNVRRIISLLGYVVDVNHVTGRPFSRQDVKAYKQKTPPTVGAGFFTGNNANGYTLTSAGQACIEIYNLNRSLGNFENDQWILLFLLLINYGKVDRQKNIIDQSNAYLTLLKQVLTEQEILDGLKNLLVSLSEQEEGEDNKNIFFSNDMFWYITFAYDRKFISIYKNSLNSERTRLQNYVQEQTNNRNNNDCIAGKFISGIFTTTTFIDELKILYLTSQILINQFNDFEEYKTLLLDKYSEIVDFDEQAVNDFINTHRNTYESVYNSIMNYISGINQTNNDPSLEEEIILPSNNTNMIPLNTILYGVPGTGKTYNSINYAVAIIDGEDVADVENRDRESVRQRYEELVESGQIVFTTFHQSYGYEDFVEGIKAEIKDGLINYKVCDGVFKKICKEAQTNLEDSKKDIELLNEENSIRKKVNQFLLDSEDKTFEIKTGNTFVITGYDDEHIYLYNENNSKRSKIVILIEELYALLESGEEISTVVDVTNFFKLEHGRQRDSYLFALYNQIKDMEDDNSSQIDQRVERKNYVLIIDEINRGNISKIFGELITLIEPDKRIGEKEELKVKLPYSSKEENAKDFGVPNNLYIIGTMNTADRSIALIDLALRRRFKFIEKEPKPELLRGLNVDGIDIEQLFTRINNRIEFLYDKDHLLGHALFLGLKEDTSLEKLNSIMKDTVIPLLVEYFHDDRGKIQQVLGNGIIKGDTITAHNLGITDTDYDDQVKYTINQNISAQDYQIINE